MKAVAEAGTQVVINLVSVTVRDALPNEDTLVESLGMKYVHIPVNWNNPIRQNLDDFFHAMDEYKDEKVLVHCQANNRASSFVMLYRVLRLNWKKEDAMPVMEKMWNPEDFPVWQKFIDNILHNGA